MKKQCFRCKQEKDISEFYAHPEMKDGFLGKCKECTKQDVKINRASKREQYSEYDHKRNKNRREYMRNMNRKHRKAYPEKAKAHRMVNNAIRDGKIVRQPCIYCGNPKSQAHHEDYNKPFEVEWLCFKCHREKRHNQIVVSTQMT